MRGRKKDKDKTIKELEAELGHLVGSRSVTEDDLHIPDSIKRYADYVGWRWKHLEGKQEVTDRIYCKIDKCLDENHAGWGRCSNRPLHNIEKHLWDEHGVELGNPPPPPGGQQQQQLAPGNMQVHVDHDEPSEEEEQEWKDDDDEELDTDADQDTQVGDDSNTNSTRISSTPEEDGTPTEAPADLTQVPTTVSRDSDAYKRIEAEHAHRNTDHPSRSPSRPQPRQISGPDAPRHK